MKWCLMFLDIIHQTSKCGPSYKLLKILWERNRFTPFYQWFFLICGWRKHNKIFGVALTWMLASACMLLRYLLLPLSSWKIIDKVLYEYPFLFGKHIVLKMLIIRMSGEKALKQWELAHYVNYRKHYQI